MSASFSLCRRLNEAFLAAFLMAAGSLACPAQEKAQTAGRITPVYPERSWQTRQPSEVGLSEATLDALRQLLGGRGCVVRHGYLAYAWGDISRSDDVASAVKPVISTLLLLAIQEGKLKSADAPVVEVEPRLRDLNSGKDAAMTWRQLASQTSGYGLSERPGQAYAYNDFALAFYYDTLTGRVFRDDGTNILKSRVADVLQFQDRFTFEAFGPKDRPGRLALSVRDFARFGLLYARKGKWNDRQVVRQDLIELALSSPVPPELPLAGAAEAIMLPGQRTLGGGKRITAVGPGYYSFNWWLNRTDKQGRRLFVDAPTDTYVASGHGGRRMLWVIPSLDLIACWNDAAIDDHDASPGNPITKCNQAARLLCQAVLDGAPKFVPRTRVTLENGKWHINGQITYPGAKAEGLLMNVRMVNAVFEDRLRSDFDPDANTDRFLARVPDYAGHGVRAFTICLQGGMPGYERAVNSGFELDGSLRQRYVQRVRRVIEACDRQGVVVILGCYYQRQDQLLTDEAAVRAGVVNVARWIQASGFTNVVLEIANEFPHAGFDHAILHSAEGEVALVRLAKQIAPRLLVSTSGIGDGKLPVSVAEACDFLLIHFNGVPLSAIPERIAALKRFGKAIVCNEDDKMGETAARAAEVSVSNGASWGLMLEKRNQHYPFTFSGAKDDPVVYAKLKQLTSP